MKKSLLFYSLCLFGILLLASCITTNDGFTCIWTPTPCGSTKSCCDGELCYYEYDGQKYYCDGSDCDQTSEDLAEIMCNSKSATIQTESQEFTRDEMLESVESILDRNAKCSSCMEQE